MAKIESKNIQKQTNQLCDRSGSMESQELMNEKFQSRHIGPQSSEISKMLEDLNVGSIDELMDKVLPSTIRTKKPLSIPNALTEPEFLARACEIADQNLVFDSFLGMGYYDCHTPNVILRNILENPAWYTAYTPYQAEISQGRMEALLNFQTMVMDLTGMEISNASLLDESTAVAEAMAMCFSIQSKNSKRKFMIVGDSFPQTLEVLQTRALPLDIEIAQCSVKDFEHESDYFAAFIQYPMGNGGITDLNYFSQICQKNTALSVVSADLLALTLLPAPSEFSIDVVVGSAQRFGVPMGFGGPHAAFLATRSKFMRNVPGRIIGVSLDNKGNPALRLALQTREQHIRREKATSNICTAQVLLAVMASMYAVYHGPKGLKKIASRVHQLTCRLASALELAGYKLSEKNFFDTLRIELDETNKKKIISECRRHRINIAHQIPGGIGISIDEVKSETQVVKLMNILLGAANKKMGTQLPEFESHRLGSERKNEILTHPVFNSHHSETQMLRYIHKLEKKDLSLNHSMIPLGSCTMKLNATAEMLPITWPNFAKLHPFAPLDQTKGYLKLFQELEDWLCDITGFSVFSLQPNAGSQGEFAGLLAIRQFHLKNKQQHRNICLIPNSAHGTNPASAVMAGMKVVVVDCDENGNIDLDDLKQKSEKHSTNLAALMITYPSTHGVFEESIKDICKVVHDRGGQVYMDGANMNAMVGLSRPAELGADVCHLNLHKTFCIPHGGGGPGVGPIGVAEHLKDFVPSHRLAAEAFATKDVSAVSAAPWGSASILPISWGYLRMMGPDGLKLASEISILSANYIAKQLDGPYKVLYRGKNNMVAHECIIDCRNFKQSAGISVDDIAKRLMDYGFHAPTMSWPVPGTLMIEPTECESLQEIDRFCQSMIAIRKEIEDIESGKSDRNDNYLRNAPHTIVDLIGEWNRPYSREQACFPLPWVKDNKFWCSVNRVDNAHGDRNLVCSCLPVSDYQDSKVH